MAKKLLLVFLIYVLIGLLLSWALSSLEYGVLGTISGLRKMLFWIFLWPILITEFFKGYFILKGYNG